MDKFKLLPEDEAYFGPNSMLADPTQFRDVKDDHFVIQANRLDELNRLYLEKGNSRQFSIKSSSTNPSEAQRFNQKQLELAEELERISKSIYDDKARIEQSNHSLWKSNNVMVYDLGDHEYDHEAAVRSLHDLNSRVGITTAEAGMDGNYRPIFSAKDGKMVEESFHKAGKRSAQRNVLSFDDN